MCIFPKLVAKEPVCLIISVWYQITTFLHKLKCERDVNKEDQISLNVQRQRADSDRYYLPLLLLPSKKNMYSRNLRKKGHGRELPFVKTKSYKDSFLICCIYKYIWFWLKAMHRERTILYYYCLCNYNFNYNCIVLFCIFFCFFYSKHLLCNCVRLSY